MKIFFLTVFAILMFDSASEAQTGLQKTLDRHIAAQAAKDGQAVEYKEARKVLEGDIDGDGDEDAVVQYTLEGFGGGNSWGQITAVFINTKGAYKFAAEETVGGKHFRLFTLKSLAKGKITGATETCPDDAPQGLCDKPKKGLVTLVFKNNKLKEL